MPIPKYGANIVFFGMFLSTTHVSITIQLRLKTSQQAARFVAVHPQSLCPQDTKKRMKICLMCQSKDKKPTVNQHLLTQTSEHA